MVNMKKVKGIHLPNRSLKDDELQRILNLGCYHFIDLDQFPSRWELFAKEGQVHVRMLLVYSLCENIIKLVDEHPEISTIRVGNEPNLEMHITAQEWKDYLTRLFTKLPQRVLDKMSIAAPSPGLSNYVDWIVVNCEVASKFGLQQIDAHIYGGALDVIDMMRIYRTYWKGRLLVTEYNFGAGRNYTYDQWCDDYKQIMKQACYYVDAFSIFIWEWNNPDMELKLPVNIKDTPMERVVSQVEEPCMYEDYTSPNNSGPRANTKVITLHSTRSGNPTISLHNEFTASVAWHFNPNSDASCHCIVGVNEIAFPVRDDLKCWADWEYNNISLAIEMVQPTIGYTIPQVVQLACARQVAYWCVKYKIPIVWSITNGICEHFETPPGASHGKSDIGNLNRAWFLQQVKNYAQQLAPKPQMSAVRKSDLKLLPLWYLACIQADEDWTKKTKQDAIDYVKAVGGPWQNIESIGWR